MIGTISTIMRRSAESRNNSTPCTFAFHAEFLRIWVRRHDVICWTLNGIDAFIEQVNGAAITLAIVAAAELFNFELSRCLACESAHVLRLWLLLLQTALPLGTRRSIEVLFIILVAVAGGGVEGFGVLSLRGWSGLCGSIGSGGSGDACGAVAGGVVAGLLSDLLVMLTRNLLARS